MTSQQFSEQGSKRGGVPPGAMVGLVVFAGVAVILTLTLNDYGRSIAGFFGVSALLGVVALVRLESAGAFDPWAPLGFPFLYTVFTLTAGTVVAVTVGFGGAFLGSGLVTTELLLAQATFAAALLVGILLLPTRRRTSPGTRASADRQALSIASGVALLAASGGYRVYQLVSNGVGSWNQTRGVQFDLSAQLEILASLLPLVGTTLLLIGYRVPCRTVIPLVPLALLAIWALASLALGTRGEVLAPAIMLGWAYHHRVRPLTRSGVSIAIVVGFILFALVGIWRTQTAESATLGLAELVRPTSSGVNTTALTMRAVPDLSPYANGETYLAAIRATVPFAPAPQGDPSDMTAALRLPSMIGYQAQSGLGYSPVGEAYWNFGWTGLVVAPLLFGLFLAWTHRRSYAWGTSPLAYLYPVVISRLAIDLRSDALQQIKGVALVMAIVVIIWACQSVSGQKARATPISTEQEPAWR